MTIPQFSRVRLLKPQPVWLAKGIVEWPAGSVGVLLDTFPSHCEIEMFRPEPDVLSVAFADIEAV